jgi:hypothetical protein
MPGLGTHLPFEQKFPGAQSASFEHPERQSGEDPPQTVGAQGGLPAEPTGRAVQDPMRPVREHDSQLPAHALSQHTPLTQKPETQAVPEVQPTSPVGSFLEH